MGFLADFSVSTTEDALLYEKLLGDENPLLKLSGALA